MCNVQLSAEHPSVYASIYMIIGRSGSKKDVPYLDPDSDIVTVIW